MQLFSEKSLKYALDAHLPHAYWLVGCAYAYGLGESVNRQKALSFFERGAALGSTLCKRDMALLLLEADHSCKDQKQLMRWLSECAHTGAANLRALNALIHDESREHRSLAIRWLQHELVFKADWRAGFILYLSLLFPKGAVPADEEFLHDSLVSMAEERPQARKALAMGLLSGALTGRSQFSRAIRLLQRGSTPNEIALAALVALEQSHKSRNSGQRLLRAERSLFISSQSGSAIGNALLLRLTIQQMENSADQISRTFVSKSLIEHLANYPMHCNEDALRVLVRWLGEDRHLRKSCEARLLKVLMRASEMGMNAAAVALARLAAIDSNPTTAIDRLRNAALRGDRVAMEMLGSAIFISSNALSDTERHFWIHLIQVKENPTRNSDFESTKQQQTRKSDYEVA
jgi:hypothetical protein